MRRTGLLKAATVAAAAALTLTACGSPGSESAPAAGQATKQVTDARGTVEVPVPAQRVVATDNRIFRTLDQWGIELAAAPVSLVPEGVSYADDPDIIDLGTHREPKLEGFVAAEPELILNGQRFASQKEKIAELAPDAALVDTEIDVKSKPIDAELKRQSTLLGEVFDRPQDAEKLNADLDASIERVKAAYRPEQKVMGLLTSGGDISYVAPGAGRAIGPMFPVLGLTPALEQQAGDASHGDDISVEAIAAANPDWLFVLDRDAATEQGGQEFTGAQELIVNSEALRNVPAVKEGRVLYLPANFYVTEDIQAYTEFFNSAADAMERQR